LYRRGFLKTAAWASLSPLKLRARDEFVPGLELITVLALLGDNFGATLQAVADIGYRQVETLGSLGRSPAEVREALSACHLVSPAQHLVPDDLYGVYQRWDRGSLAMPEALRELRQGYDLQHIERIVDQGLSRAHAMGQAFLVWPVLFDEHVASPHALDALIRALNAAGALCQREGVNFAFHNGSKAFERIGSDVVYDLILRNTNPEAVKMEWDTFYAAKAGADALRYFADYPDRFRLVHLKDMASNGEITDLGKGTVRFPALIAAAQGAGVRHFFVEHDQARNPLASARAGFDYVKRL
jgi:sugar phosphate isomerase/epimerase